MLSHVRLSVTPWTVACQASLSTKSKSESCSVVSDTLRPHELIQSMKFSRPEYWSGKPFPSPGDLPNPGIEPRSPALQVDSLPAEPQGKPKNTRVGCHALLQRIFPTQGSNPGLPHCKKTPLPSESQYSMVIAKY